MKRNLYVLFFILLFFGRCYSQNNFDFELSTPGIYTASNSVSGWTVSSATATNNCSPSGTWNPGSAEFAILATPIVTNSIIGFINHSPLGGVNVAQLNSTVSNSSCTKLVRTITVTPLYNNFRFAFAGVFEGLAHICCDQPSFYFLLKDQQNNVIDCNSFTMTPPGVSCQNGVTGYSYSPNGSTWTNWQTKTVDLSPYTNSVVTIEIIVNDCIAGDHYGTLYFDALLCNLYLNTSANTTLTSVPNPVNNCLGSGITSITGPLGYSSYQWYYLPGPGFTIQLGTQSTLTLSNTGPGSVYKLNVISPGGCLLSYVYTITPTLVNINAIGSSPSCTLGASGSATVFTSGGGTGHIYSWFNSANSIVGTSSVVSGLIPGNYTVNVSAGSNSSCGTASTAVTIGIKPKTVTPVFKHHCGAAVTLSAGPGSNFQWYSGTTAIPTNQGGTASSFAVNSPSNGSIYRVSYLSNQGCSDSLEFILLQVPSGSLNVSNPLVCPSSSNGSVNISINPSPNAPWGMNSYSVFSTGNFTPVYSSSLSPTNLNNITITGLSAGVTYSVIASDGQCSYTRSFVTIPLYNYSISPSSPTVCSGSFLNASVVLSNILPTTFSYSWSPSTFIFGNGGQNAIINPTVPLGLSTTIIYSVTVSPAFYNCPITKTLTVTVVNIATPTIVPIPTLCANSSDYSVTVIPTSGTFYSNNNSITQSGLLSPYLANAGVNSFTYANSIGSCLSQATSTFLIISPSLATSSSTNIFCGQTVTLSATGADLYLWSNGSTSSSIAVAPISTTIYSVTGTNTTNSCSKTQTAQISVTSSLVVSIVGSSTLCIGNTGALSATGANTYTWNSGAISPNILISPQATTSYSVIGTDILGCKSSTQIQVFVYSLPHPLVAGNFSICPGVETTLNAYNVYSFLWNTGATTSTILVSPSVTTIYTVTGIDFYGCKNTKTVTVVVSGCVGLEDLSQNTSLVSIYPNPNNGIFSIEAAGKINLLITDALGKVIFEKEFEQGHSSLNLGSHMNGIYFVKTVYKGEVKIIKLVKTN